MISRRPGSHLMFVALALAATLPAAKARGAEGESDRPEKKPEPQSNSLEARNERLAKTYKPESSFARERRLKREQKGDFPTHCEIEVAKTFEPQTAFKQYGPPKSKHQRTPPPKHHHRPRGRGR